MLIEKIGEFGLIDRIKNQAFYDKSVIKGIGDDCAVLEYTKDKYQLYTCDMLVENVDFTHKDNMELVGRKALAVSISDVASCGGIPRYAVVSLGVSKQTNISKIDKFSKGLFNLAKEFKINIVGGDISKADSWIIDVSLIGEVRKKDLVLRSGAQIDDIVMVTGEFGGSINGKHLKFMPRIKESQYLVKKFKINSMIDVSDGLSKDLCHILKESNKGAVIYEGLIPQSKYCKSIDNALSDGEDFELVFTLGVKEAQKLLKETNKFRAIGYIVDKKFGLQLLCNDGKYKKIKAKGFEHFKTF